MATTNYRELRNVIGQWCFDVTGRVMRIAGSGEIDQPGVPYAVVWLNQDSFVGYPKKQLSEDGLIHTVTRTARFSVKIDVYGGDADKSAMQDASLLQNALFNPVLFQDSGGAPQKNLWEICGLQSIESLDDLSALETGIIKQRAQLSFSIMAELSDSFASDYYDKVEVDVRRKEPDIDIETLTIDPNAPPPSC